jgi:hypothetical protein
MPDGSSAESAGESLPEPAPSAPTPEADAPIAQAPTGKQPQRRPLWMWIAGGALVLFGAIRGHPLGHHCPSEQIPVETTRVNSTHTASII